MTISLSTKMAAGLLKTPVVKNIYITGANLVGLGISSLKKDYDLGGTRREALYHLREPKYDVFIRDNEKFESPINTKETSWAMHQRFKLFGFPKISTKGNLAAFFGLNTVKVAQSEGKEDLLREGITFAQRVVRERYGDYFDRDDNPKTISFNFVTGNSIDRKKLPFTSNYIGARRTEKFFIDYQKRSITFNREKIDDIYQSSRSFYLTIFRAALLLSAHYSNTPPKEYEMGKKIGISERRKKDGPSPEETDFPYYNDPLATSLTFEKLRDFGIVPGTVPARIVVRDVGETFSKTFLKIALREKLLKRFFSKGEDSDLNLNEKRTVNNILFRCHQELYKAKKSKDI